MEPPRLIFGGIAPCFGLSLEFRPIVIARRNVLDGRSRSRMFTPLLEMMLEFRWSRGTAAETAVRSRRLRGYLPLRSAAFARKPLLLRNPQGLIRGDDVCYLATCSASRNEVSSLRGAAITTKIAKLRKRKAVMHRSRRSRAISIKQMMKTGTRRQFRGIKPRPCVIIIGQLVRMKVN